jgi:hypothetical protein
MSGTFWVLVKVPCDYDDYSWEVVSVHESEEGARAAIPPPTGKKFPDHEYEAKGPFEVKP